MKLTLASFTKIAPWVHWLVLNNVMWVLFWALCASLCHVIVIHLLCHDFSESESNIQDFWFVSLWANCSQTCFLCLIEGLFFCCSGYIRSVRAQLCGIHFLLLCHLVGSKHFILQSLCAELFSALVQSVLLKKNSLLFCLTAHVTVVEGGSALPVL